MFVGSGYDTHETLPAKPGSPKQWATPKVAHGLLKVACNYRPLAVQVDRTLKEECFGAYVGSPAK